DCPLLALSGPKEAPATLSAFGGKADIQIEWLQPHRLTQRTAPGLARSRATAAHRSEDRKLISARAPARATDSYAARVWGGQPIPARKSRFSAGPRLPEPHERSCSRGS